jgi:hypothetical protein
MNDDELAMINQRLDRLEDRLDSISLEIGYPKEIGITYNKPKKETHPITAILAIIIVVLVISLFL